MAAADQGADDIVGHLYHQPRSANRGGERSAAVNRLDAKGRDQPAVILASLRKSGDRLIGNPIGGVEVRLVGIVLDLDVDPHARTGVERCIQGGDVRRQVAGIDIDDGAAVGKARIVMDHEHPVAGRSYVELDRVATERPGEAKGLDSVLGRGPRCPAMGKYRYQRYAPSVGTMEENTSI